MTAQIVQEANLALQVRHDGHDATFLPVAMESPGHGHAENYAAFLLPGLLGLNLLSMGLFSVGMVNVSYREKGKFRRLAVTPLPKWVFLAGQVLHRLTITFAQAACMLLVGWVFFGIANQGSWLLLVLVMGLGTACFMCMGFALSGFARTSEGYGAISNAFFFPMMFLSGVYFTLDSAPRWMQLTVVALPLSPYLKALRAVFNDGASLAGHGAGLAIVAVWTAGCFFVALKKFSWA
jgi:ABC-2 type transport system permease protein